MTVYSLLAPTLSSYAKTIYCLYICKGPQEAHQFNLSFKSHMASNINRRQVFVLLQL